MRVGKSGAIRGKQRRGGRNETPMNTNDRATSFLLPVIHHTGRQELLHARYGRLWRVHAHDKCNKVTSWTFKESHSRTTVRGWKSQETHSVFLLAVVVGSVGNLGQMLRPFFIAAAFSSDLAGRGRGQSPRKSGRSLRKRRQVTRNHNVFCFFHPNRLSHHLGPNKSAIASVKGRGVLCVAL